MPNDSRSGLPAVLSNRLVKRLIPLHHDCVQSSDEACKTLQVMKKQN